MDWWEHECRTLERVWKIIPAILSAGKLFLKKAKISFQSFWCFSLGLPFFSCFFQAICFIICICNRNYHSQMAKLPHMHIFYLADMVYGNVLISLKTVSLFQMYFPISLQMLLAVLASVWVQHPIFHRLCFHLLLEKLEKRKRWIYREKVHQITLPLSNIYKRCKKGLNCCKKRNHIFV